MKKYFKYALRAMLIGSISVGFVSCDEDDPIDGTQPENTVRYKGVDIPIKFVNIDFGFETNGIYKTYLDVHDGPSANSFDGSSFFMSVGCFTSDSLTIDEGTYTYDMTSQALGFFDFFEFRRTNSGDTSYYGLQHGEIEIINSEHEGNYEFNFDFHVENYDDSTDVTHVEGSYNGSTRYFAFKTEEVH